MKTHTILSLLSLSLFSLSLLPIVIPHHGIDNDDRRRDTGSRVATRLPPSLFQPGQRRRQLADDGRAADVARQHVRVAGQQAVGFQAGQEGRKRRGGQAVAGDAGVAGVIGKMDRQQGVDVEAGELEGEDGGFVA